LGAVIGNAKSVGLLRRAMPPFPVNRGALATAEAAVKDRRAIRRYVREVLRLRAWLATKLKRLGVVTYPSAGNFLLANFGPPGPALFRRLEHQGILLRDRSKDIGAGFVRITIGTQSEMRQLLAAIERNWKG